MSRLVSSWRSRQARREGRRRRCAGPFPETTVLVRHDRFDEVRPRTLQRRPDDVVVVGGEIAVVVVDVDEVDVVALARRSDDSDHRVDDLGDIRSQAFRVFMLVGVQHVDDKYRGLATDCFYPVPRSRHVKGDNRQ